MLDSVIWDGIFDGRFADRSHAIEMYERWTDHVVETVPAERLLVFDVAQGWGPLCTFLDVPLPTRPFPRVNDKVTFQRRLEAIRIASWTLPATAAAGIVAAGWSRTRGRS